MSIRSPEGKKGVSPKKGAEVAPQPDGKVEDIKRSFLRTLAREEVAGAWAERMVPGPRIETAEDFDKYHPGGLVVIPDGNKATLSPEQQAGQEELREVAAARRVLVEHFLQTLEKNTGGIHAQEKISR